uniref:Trypsin-like serine protease n=1 Tax=Magnetococcus massalia (strain MO-1) TaxID=451514 RepID=A0A1S7LJX6_MAGMO|nr:Exported protein of unknown function [Candidatus Magnetococcus massalia]
MSFWRKGSVFLTLLLTLLLAGCATKSSVKSDGTIRYTRSFTPVVHLSRLVKSETWHGAAWVINHQHKALHSPAYIEEAKPLMAPVFAHYEKITQEERDALKQQVEQVRWPMPAKRWPAIKKALARADGLVSKLKQQELYKNGRNWPEDMKRALNQLSQVRQEMATDASVAFSRAPIEQLSSFFSRYPATLSPENFFDVNRGVLNKRLAGVPTAQYAELLQAFGRYLPQQSRQRMRGRFLHKARQAQQRGDLKQLLVALNEMHAMGLDLAEGSDLKIKVMDISSPTLIDQGVLEFPVGIKPDLPFEISKAGLDEAFKSYAEKDVDILIMLDLSYAKVHRDTQEQKMVGSKRIVAYKEVRNPEYKRIKRDVEILERDASFKRMDTSTAYLAGGLVGALIAHSKAKTADESYVSARTRLDEVEEYIQAPVYGAYQYGSLELKMAKVVTTQLHLFDLRSNRYFSDTVDLVEKRPFKLAYDVDRHDIDRARIERDFDSEKEAKAYEKRAVELKLSEIINHYVESQSEAKPLPSLLQLKQQLQQQRNATIAAHAQEKMEGDYSHERRMRHVVKLQSGGSHGSGFYIDSDLILTNEHVVAGREYMQVIRPDGREGFGSVLAVDPRRDLAIIKVDLRGDPVRFYDNSRIPIGAQVQVLGSPADYAFSVTSGVVSAVRKVKIHDQAIQGLKAVTYVQIDAATTGGNSGGPVFLGDQVVGIVDWGDNRPGAENLNFIEVPNHVCMKCNDSL